MKNVGCHTSADKTLLNECYSRNVNERHVEERLYILIYRYTTDDQFFLLLTFEW